MIPRPTLKLWVWTIAAIAAAAGWNGMIAKGELILAMYSVAFALLLGLWGFWLHINSSRNAIIGRLILVGVVFVGSIHFYNRIRSISPVAKTLTIHEMNSWGRQIWKGAPHASLNLLTRPSLEAESSPTEDQPSYILQPAIRHEADGSTARIRLFLHIPDACHFTLLSFMYSRHTWLPPQTIREDFTSYETAIPPTIAAPSVPSGEFRIASDFGFIRTNLEVKSCRVIYQFFGIDDEERRIPPRETEITLTFP